MVLASYSIGEFLGSIIWGWIFDRFTMKFSMISCILTGFTGSILYAVGDYVSWGAYLVFAGRFIQGLWTGGQ